MPFFGAHMSIAGGVHNALLAAEKYECGAVQLFTASPQMWHVWQPPARPAAFRSGKLLMKNKNQWLGKPLAKAGAELFHATHANTRVRQLVAHDSYLINLASPDPTLYRRSVEAFVDEMRRAETLRLDFLVFHPGAATDGDEHAGLKRIAKALNEAQRRCGRCRCNR